MTENNKKVSVIIPVFNAEAFLREAILSVLNQTHPPYEVVVVDDGSTDGSADVAKAFSGTVQYYYQPNSGHIFARNTGIEKASGDYLAFIDADDLWLKNKIEIQLAAFISDDDLDAVFSHVIEFKQQQKDQVTRLEFDHAEHAVPGYLCSTFLVKTTSFHKVGDFSTQFRLGELIDWLSRAEVSGLKIKMLTNVLALRRVHDNNMGVLRRDIRIDYARVLKAKLNRQRKTENH